MLVLILLWLLLSVITFTIGLGLLYILRADCLHRQGDRLMIALWLGLFTLAWALFTVSLLFPLSPWVGLAVAGGLMAIALTQRNTSQEGRRMLKTLVQMPWRWKIAGVALTLATAFFSAQGIIWFDTGLYHYQAIEWFRQYGTVTGLALIHHRFGTSSSWFALAAPFNFGIFSAKITACIGGFTFLLALLHSSLILKRIIDQNQGFSDWFLGLSFFLVIPTLFWSSLPFATSPDQPILFITIIIAWLILWISQHRTSAQDQSILIPLILTGMSTAVKLSALPLVALAFVFYVFHQADDSVLKGDWKIQNLKTIILELIFKLTFLKALLHGVFVSLALITPLLVFNTITSGCMLFPSTLFCFNLPWSMSLARVQATYQEIKEWNRWIGLEPNDEFLGWLRPWVDAEGQFAFLGICAIITLILLLIYHRQTIVPGQSYLMVMSILGITYVMFTAPTWRFGLNYACILPAFLLAEYCHQNSKQKAWAVVIIVGTANAWLEVDSFSFLLIFALSIMAIAAVYIYKNFTTLQFLSTLSLLSLLIIVRHYILTHQNLHINVGIYPIFPPSLQETYAPQKFKALQTNNVTYFVPTDGTELCWAAPLPCTYALSDQNIQLRDPDRGIGAGFIKVPTQSQ